MKTIRTLSALAAAFLTLSAPAAFADGTLDLNLQEVALRYAAQGIFIHDCSTGTLREDGVAVITLQADAGDRLVIRGQGDDGVFDLDLWLVDPSGRTVKVDADYDATPLLEFTARRTGTYRIYVKMAACAGYAADYGIILAERL